MKRSLGVGLSFFGTAILASIGCASILGDEFKVGPSSGPPVGDSGSLTDGPSGPGPHPGEAGTEDAVGGPDAPPPVNPLSCDWLLANPRVLESVTGVNMSNDHGLFNRLSVHHVAPGGVRIVTGLNDKAFRYYDFKTGGTTPLQMFELAEQGQLLSVKRVAGGIGILFQTTGATSQSQLNVFQLLDKSNTLEQPRAQLTNPGDVSASNLSATFVQRMGNEYDYLAAYQASVGGGYAVSAGRSPPPFFSQLLLGPQRYSLDGAPLLYVPGAPDAFVSFFSADVGGPSPSRSFSLSSDMKSFSTGASSTGVDVSKKAFSMPLDIAPGLGGKFNVAILAGDFSPSVAVSVRIAQVDGPKLYGIDADSLVNAVVYTNPDRLAIQGGSHWFGEKFATAGPGFVMNGTDFKPANGLNFNYFDANGALLADLSDTKKLLTDLPGQIKGADFDAADDPDTFDVSWVSEVPVAGSSPPVVNDTLLYNQLRCHR